jgi:hypothetical protein
MGRNRVSQRAEKKFFPLVDSEAQLAALDPLCFAVNLRRLFGLFGEIHLKELAPCAWRVGPLSFANLVPFVCTKGDGIADLAVRS